MQANDDACGNGNADNYNSQRRPAKNDKAAELSAAAQRKRLLKRQSALEAFLLQFHSAAGAPWN